MPKELQFHFGLANPAPRLAPRPPPPALVAPQPINCALVGPPGPQPVLAPAPMAPVPPIRALAPLGGPAAMVAETKEAVPTPPVLNQEGLSATQLAGCLNELTSMVALLGSRLTSLPTNPPVDRPEAAVPSTPMDQTAPLAVMDDIDSILDSPDFTEAGGCEVGQSPK